MFWSYWRQEIDKSGYNVLALGILHETLLRWAPPPVSVFARTQTFTKTRPSGHGDAARPAEVTIPDSVQILTDLENGGRGLYHLSGVCRFGPGNQIHLYGSEATLRYEATPAEKEAVIGSFAARKLRLSVGDIFHPFHGLVYDAANQSVASIDPVMGGVDR